ncbi:uracil-DNA glycosylase [Accumulibacter sp.]|uniref:uracil-DNA glycosylase n=1 Tax=Accumulibacter sp. TaxID=2053492 RepID=UPI0025E4C693|nr:uracil-DNA glycosylase [Accumulibacter sp.]MCM8610843.1 uracil-DNA glycosylase [Accumulibacter sp.]MCM8635240.1 uracil-DNA glycosylase [Accumulibacter sp.]MCM8638611.1 uracil-DNA glycosylase [Accumulibacter sp.]
MGGELRRPLLTRLQLLREMGLSPLWRLRPQAAGVAQPLVGGTAAGSEAEPGSPGEPAAAAAGVPVPAAGGERNVEIAGMGWEELRQSAAICRACNLCQGRRQAVLGVGDLKADWLFIGEGPGAEEDARGEPFVGPAGKLLDAMLAAIDLQRGDDVYIANAVKCRPPGNRTPESSEIAACAPYLRRQIALLQPRLIVLLGRAAAHAVLGEVGSLANMRGRSFAYRSPAGGEDIPVIVSYHPAYLLRTLHDKARAWEDLCRARALMRAAKGTATGRDRAAGPDAAPTP